MNSNSQQRQYKVKISIRANIWNITVSDQWNRKENKHTTGKVKDGRDTNTEIN